MHSTGELIDFCVSLLLMGCLLAADFGMYRNRPDPFFKNGRLGLADEDFEISSFSYRRMFLKIID